MGVTTAPREITRKRGADAKRRTIMPCGSSLAAHPIASGPAVVPTHQREILASGIKEALLNLAVLYAKILEAGLFPFEWLLIRRPRVSINVSSDTCSSSAARTTRLDANSRIPG